MTRIRTSLLAVSLASFLFPAAAVADYVLYYSPDDVCIGGELCGRDAVYEVDLIHEHQITKVEVYAHDQIGGKTKAHLQCFVDGRLVGELDVKKAGSKLTFTPNTSGSTVVLKSVEESHASGGDETMIDFVAIYGE